MAPRKLTPPVLGADASQKAVAALRKHLSAQLSPVLCVEDAALAARCRAMASRASALHASQPDARQEAFPLDGPDWSQLREDLTALAERTLRKLAPDVPQLPLDARLCLRRYPPGKRGQRLGAHVDDTLCTLLWASTPGLEILAPRDDAEWTGTDVAKVGLPTMGPPPKIVGEGDWATVTPPSADCFLFTPGNGWGGVVTSVPLRSPTLHRVAVGGDVERLSLPLLVSVRGDYGSALNSVGEALRQISLAGAPAAEDRLSPLAEVLGVELLRHLDAESLCRLNMCARFFGEEDATTRRSRCEDVARERALDLMDGHMAGLCVLEGVNSVRELHFTNAGVIRGFLAAFYQCLKLDGNRMFPFLPDGRTRRPDSRWPRGCHAFQGWFHTLYGFEAGPVADYAAACALYRLADNWHGPREPGAPEDEHRPADTLLIVARERMESALLSRQGEFEVLVGIVSETMAPDERIAELVTRHGGLRWARSIHNGKREPYGMATFPSLPVAIEALALRDEEEVRFMDAGQDWQRFFNPGMHRLMSVL